MNSPIRYTWMPSPLGNVLLVGNDTGLRGVYFHDQKYLPTIDAAWQEDNRMAVLREARRQLGEYFAGSRERFDVPLAPEGTPFQRAIWNAIAEVPCGATRTYADLAVRTGRLVSWKARQASSHGRPQKSTMRRAQGSKSSTSSS